MMKEIAARKQNWIDFMDPKSSVNRLLVIGYYEDFPVRPLLWWEKAREREEWSYERYMRLMEDVSYIPDNTVPYLNMLTGTEIFAEAFGCRVYKPENNTPFALPMISSVADLHKIKKPRLEDTKLVELFNMCDHLRARVGKDALFGLPDVQTPMDVAALIWDKSDFFAALYEEPEAVKELAQMIREFMFEFFDAWFAHNGKEFIAHWPDFYMPYGITMSEDEIGSVSSDMYKEFFEEEINAFSDRYGAIGVHSCANTRHQWENLSRIRNLKLINLGQPRSEIVDSLDYFRDVCGQYPSANLTDWSGVENPEQYHIAQYPFVRTRDQARYVAEYYAEHKILPVDWRK